ncbi:hypothetical protein G6038_12560 [Rhodococcus sp. 14C212]|uniref:hypothetical protein n=1 Tax=Rhodococcus sp. 14C212 TaxID=2711209 RepID=UPI0013ED181A|nr:hypothetical protein [Rhodococcus sp. 14C212]NGP06298.1 hypothetical protein [Rhodococcus sp. 14C212]
MVIEEMFDDDADGDADRWSSVECVGSRPGYRDMEVFLDSVDDPALAEQLRIAISGEALSVASRTRSRSRPPSFTGIACTRTNARSVVHAHGSQTRGIEYVPAMRDSLLVQQSPLNAG